MICKMCVEYWVMTCYEYLCLSSSLDVNANQVVSADSLDMCAF
jgi:hypothetical protein